MSQQKNIQSQVELVNTLKFIAQAFEEISVMRMRKVRESVVDSREFVKQISTVFHDVKSSYQEKIKELMKNKKLAGAQSPVVDKKLSILISANSKLYGEVVNTVFQRFYEASKAPNVDLLIIGKLGKELYERESDKKNYLYFEIPDSEVFIQDIQAIMYHLIRYDDIDVYYAHFENILHQDALVSNITGDEPFEVEESSPNQEVTKFFFEPDLEEILTVFKTQVFIALFKQTIHEAHLAHYASRVTAMEQALVNVERQSQILYSEQRKAHKQEENKKILERVAGRLLYL